MSTEAVKSSLTMRWIRAAENVSIMQEDPVRTVGTEMRECRLCTCSSECE